MYPHRVLNGDCPRRDSPFRFAPYPKATNRHHLYHPSFRQIGVVEGCEASRNGNGGPLKTIGVIQFEDNTPRKSPPSNVGFYFGTKSKRIKIYYALKSHGKAKLKLQAKIRQINHIITSSSGACPHKTPQKIAPTIGLAHRASRESPRNESPKELGTSRSAEQPATNNRLQQGQAPSISDSATENTKFFAM